jgi:hypothetical protein
MSKGRSADNKNSFPDFFDIRKSGKNIRKVEK